MYAIVKTGGKQYRVEQGQSLLVERLPASAEGDTVTLQPLLCVDGAKVVDGSDLSGVSVSAKVVAHERGPKLRVVKFKPKRGYKRRTGHRQELTRLEVTSIKLGAGSRSRSSRAKPGEAAAKQGEAAAKAGEAAAKQGEAPAKPGEAAAKQGEAAAKQGERAKPAQSAKQGEPAAKPGERAKPAQSEEAGNGA